MPTLELDHLSKTFSTGGSTVRALNDLTFTVNPGEVYGFVGSNGAGKSTAMRITLGVLSPDSGEARVDGTPVNDDIRRIIGYMPEERGLYDKERIADQLEFFGRLHGLTRASARKTTAALLEQLGLADRADSRLEELSLGNQQRVQLAASLVHDPALLILDEPFSGLDPVAVSVMSEMLLAKAAEGVPVLFSSHQLDLVQRLCDRVGIITRGEMRAEGTVDELRGRGPVIFEIRTPARDWYPPGTTVTGVTGGEGGPGDDGSTVLLDAGGVDDQTILNAALAAGPVHGFTRRVPDLNELFKEVVAS
ncbi:ABC transporter ATP-binding protein NatA [Corynebacterium provencense]|uniref:ABC transporter ATP-binding protein NatA n=1 Tax=Corynebacterium provencense TaxID=1737425 RepID=A0A2Z3YXP0_9CORY|nr:ATP-binding cassette domain-containing protein [Corynebacterium provencense]AWT26847.1 ABC transporter ATP-binding protein NatA [Corynebacterium provencense]